MIEDRDKKFRYSILDWSWSGADPQQILTCPGPRELVIPFGQKTFTLFIFRLDQWHWAPTARPSVAGHRLLGAQRAGEEATASETKNANLINNTRNNRLRRLFLGRRRRQLWILEIWKVQTKWKLWFQSFSSLSFCRSSALHLQTSDSTILKPLVIL